VTTPRGETTSEFQEKTSSRGKPTGACCAAVKLEYHTSVDTKGHLSIVITSTTCLNSDTGAAAGRIAAALEAVEARLSKLAWIPSRDFSWT
jgi:hypothetical protein